MAEDHLHDDDAFKARIDWALWRKVLVFARPYKREFLALSTLAIILAGCELVMPLITGSIVDDIKAHGLTARPMRFGMMYVGVIVVLAACVFAFILVAGRITVCVSYDIREAAFAKLQDLPFAFYDRKAVGWLMARLTSDCSQISRIMGWALLDIVWGTFLLSSTTVVMFAKSWRLALVVMAVVPPMLIVCRFFQVRLLLTSRALRKANSHTTAGFNEGIVGVRTTKSLVREERNLSEFRELTGAMYGHAVRNALYSAVFIPVVGALCAVAVALALWRGGAGVVAGWVSLGTLVTFVQYALHLSGPVQELANAITNVQGAQASAERVQGLLDTDAEIKDSAEVVAAIGAASALTGGPVGSASADRLFPPRAASAPTGGTPGRGVASSAGEGTGGTLAIDGGPARIESIEFRDVSFAYKEGQSVLEDFNLSIEPGQSIALVGPTGGGKTTIVGLACRFYEPTSGQILINGVDYRRRSLRWLQSSLGIVLQQPHLFSGTIRENIRYGRLSATDAEVEGAAKLTSAHEFIMAMKDGYAAQVGEGGNQLSTGQKQLIALARAVLADPQVFVMDEATSSVDTQTERAIQSAVERILENRISFVIAHRLSTIRSADRILLIDGGKIVEDGSHHELIQQRGRYFELYTNQFTQEREAHLLERETEAVAEA